MDFKCLFIERTLKPIKNVDWTSYDFVDFDIIDAEIFDDGYIAIRVQRKQSPIKYGVCEKGNLDANPLIEELRGKEMVIQDFIIINQNVTKFSVYYCGAKNYVTQLLEELYHIKGKEILSEVSIDDLATISEIKVTAYRYGQMNIFQPMDPFPLFTDIEKVFDKNDDLEKADATFYVRKGGSFFRRKELKEVIKKMTNNDFRKLTFEGLDKYGNSINYSDGIFAKKIKIFSDDVYRSFDQRKMLSLLTLKDEIKRVITSG